MPAVLTPAICAMAVVFLTVVIVSTVVVFSMAVVFLTVVVVSTIVVMTCLLDGRDLRGRDLLELAIRMRCLSDRGPPLDPAARLSTAAKFAFRRQPSPRGHKAYYRGKARTRLIISCNMPPRRSARPFRMSKEALR